MGHKSILALQRQENHYKEKLSFTSIQKLHVRNMLLDLVKSSLGNILIVKGCFFLVTYWRMQRSACVASFSTAIKLFCVYFQSCFLIKDPYKRMALCPFLLAVIMFNAFQQTFCVVIYVFWHIHFPSTCFFYFYLS